MALPAAYNPISLGQIQTEFCGSNPIALAGEYYRGGAYVTQNNTNVPTSGTISLSNFYGATRAYIVAISFTRNANNQNSFYLNSPGLPTITITTTVNGGGSVSTYYIPINTTFSVTSNPNTSIRLTDNTMELDDNINNDPDGDYNDLTITPNVGYFSESGGNFYYELNRACGDENEFIVRISSTTTNVNVLTLFETTYPGSWTQNVPKRLIINSGVVVGSLDPGAYALTIPGGVVSTLRIDNNGSIQGAGGGPGYEGGPAILANTAVTIDNIGSIYGGGGGGGFGGYGGTGQWAAFDDPEIDGGGGSYTIGYADGGLYGDGGYGQGYAQNATGGGAGEPGGNVGCGVVADFCTQGAIIGAGGAGGAGGSFGNNGSPGQTGGNGNYSGGYPGDPGYLAGCYITNSGNVTWVNTGDRRGRVC